MGSHTAYTLYKVPSDGIRPRLNQESTMDNYEEDLGGVGFRRGKRRHKR